ncbi:MAG: hyperosmotically inducible periplasmic protein [Clostridia bacterium]|nr:hyperosmotically inducible periplasmic protein [Clostridia bacterium]MDN5322600.1 hyperosmotically inducible periplasmic protein [Clostridia bacterium]
MTKDDQLKANIEEILSNNMQNTALGINVQVEKGFVKLHGMVDTLAEREYAAELVKKLPFVKGIDNGLTVAMDNFRNDDEIMHLLLEKFMDEPKLDIKKIGAECEKGEVILRGQASSLGEIELAKELAAQVPGVKEVKSLVKYTEEAKEMDDSSVVNAVEVAFSASDIVEAEDIDTSCINGIVKLEGVVDNNEQKGAAELLAKTVPGVRKVINNLETRHDNTRGDGYLTNKLRKALNKDERVSPAQVKVYVIDGTAYLSGKVFNIDAKKAAEEIAREMDGIRKVVNDVTVAYH